jgi:1,4-alpha-glucan branching enzyme
MAAGFTALIALSTLAVTQRQIAPAFSPVFTRKTDTVHVVRFIYRDTTARQIAVVGDFNGWGATEFPLVVNENGVWTATIALPAGAYEYAFVVDRDQWAADPSAISSRDEFGTPTSRVNVGAVDYSASE